MDIALHVLVTVRLLNVLHAPIQDCDEVFNYLEPLNFITRGFGKQTWEYSPVFAIRSYAFLAPLAVLIKPFTYLVDTFQLFPAWWLFYLVRVVVAGFTVFAEYQLYTSLKNTLKTKNIAQWYYLFTLVSTGYTHASVAFLPSTFAMNCACLSLSSLVYFVNTRKTRHALLSINWLIIGSLWGWPFVAVLVVPLLSYIVCIASKIMFNRVLLWSIVSFFFNMVTIMQLDYSFYSKTMLIPLNIVLYNVINTSDVRGPEIFGVEPIQYYIYNLLLNFNVIAPLASIGLVFAPLLGPFKKINNTGLKAKELVVILSGLGIWCLVFFNQAHKEERFLYPVYSYINLSAAFAIHFALNFLVLILESVKLNKTVVQLFKKLVIIVVVLLTAIVSVLKSAALVKNYNGYTELYKYIPSQVNENVNTASDQEIVIVCTGREWHHYPSSFFLPSNHRLQFISSSFDGLLPGNFLESDSIFNGVRQIPEGMNDLNQFDPSKLVELDTCDYVLDISEDVDFEHGEVNFWNNADWELVRSLEVIDANKSHGLAKLIWLPEVVKQHGEKVELLGESVYQNIGLFKRKSVQ